MHARHGTITSSCTVPIRLLKGAERIRVRIQSPVQGLDQGPDQGPDQDQGPDRGPVQGPVQDQGGTWSAWRDAQSDVFRVLMPFGFV